MTDIGGSGVVSTMGSAEMDKSSKEGKETKESKISSSQVILCGDFWF